MTDPGAGRKYLKPKILLVDLPDEATQKLASAGFNVQAGTFGMPFRVSTSDSSSVPLVARAHLPNCTEQEVVILDLTPPRAIHLTALEGEGNSETIDPRPTKMTEVRHFWNRILESGGVFVVFAQPRIDPSVSRKPRSRNLEPVVGTPQDNWSFVPILSPRNFRAESDLH